MQLLSYNGIILECLHTREIDRTAVFTEDKTTYLYTRWTIDVECVYHGGQTSYRAVGVGDPLPLAGEPPVLTDVAIRQYLMQPRKKLKVISGNETLLETPRAGTVPPMVTDAANGPLPQSCRVERIPGEFTTWVVSFRIIAHVNECTGTDPMLSHRWSRAQSYSEDHFATVVTTGTARFRTDELLRQNLVADDFRRSFFHPVVPFYKRIHVEVSPHEDGAGVDYTLIDKEQPFGMGTSNPATRVEGAVTGWYGMTGAIRAAGQGMQAAMNNMMGAANAQGGGMTLDPIGTVWNFVLGSAMVANNAALSSLPKYHLNCCVRAWGNALAAKADLTKLALGVALARTNGVTRARATQEFRLTHDLWGKFVEVEITLSWGDDLLPNLTAAFPLSAIITAAGQGLVNAWGSPSENAIVSLVSPASEAVAVTGLPGSPGILSNNAQYPPLPNANGTRGTSTLKLITAALQGTCTGPVTPPPTNVLGN